MNIDNPEEKLIEIRGQLKGLLANWPTEQKYHDDSNPFSCGYYQADVAPSVKYGLQGILEDLEANEKD